MKNNDEARLYHMCFLNKLRLWNLLRHYPAAAQACQDAKAVALKPIDFRWKPKNDGSEYCAYLQTTRDRYTLTINTETALLPHTLVHEWLHVILNEEGYPVAWYPEQTPPPSFPQNRRIFIDALTTTLQHAEVFRRMGEIYNLEMGDYWANKEQEAIRKIQHWNYLGGTPSERMMTIASSWDLFLIGGHIPNAIQEYRMLLPLEYNVCRHLYSIVSQIGLSTANAAFQVAEEFRQEMVRYCNDFHLGKAFLEFWKSFEFMTFQEVFRRDPLF